MERESGGSSKAKKQKKHVVYRLRFEGALCEHTPLLCVQLRLATQISHKCGKLLQLLGHFEAFGCTGLWCNFLRDAVNIFECRLKKSNALLSKMWMRSFICERSPQTSVCSPQDSATLQFCANKLDKKDFFGKSDPFMVFYRSNEDGT